MNTNVWIEEEFYPWFWMKVPKSYIKRDVLFIPKSICGYLPPISVKTMLRCNGKEWWCSRRLVNGWKQFVVDNNLKKGNVLLFELVEATSGAVIFSVEELGLTNA
ncbi:hypothetical protein A4A49_56591 [Nicotiana attenuata]|uniref:TF-B3 domain-containing protein n=1 Tax=Nicotiana attenuata TaxID=49451 RepID=A0A1J6IUQ4_NICAT|nr:hypothetical protein A4A49_56591 [Nicotiana attenuata]